MNFLKISLLSIALLSQHTWAQKVVLVGASTVATYNTGTKQGWGSAFGKYLVSSAKVHNLAKGGTSTKTYVSKGYWKKALAEKGKFVFIQFGHNDQSKNHSKPGSTYNANLRRMVNDVKKMGGTPVLVSPTRRLRFVGSNRMSSELTPFANAVRQVAAEEKVPFVDLHNASKNAYVKMGEKEALKYFVKEDRTHSNAKGANLLAKLVAEECLKDPVLKKLIK